MKDHGRVVRSRSTLNRVRIAILPPPCQILASPRHFHSLSLDRRIRTRLRLETPTPSRRRLRPLSNLQCHSTELFCVAQSVNNPVQGICRESCTAPSRYSFRVPCSKLGWKLLGAKFSTTLCIFRDCHPLVSLAFSWVVTNGFFVSLRRCLCCQVAYLHVSCNLIC